MAISFARLQYVSRSTGGNSCLKAAYNKRSKVSCERSGETFFFGHRGGNVHHEILLPQGVDSRFQQSAALWNEVEWAEKRQNSQVAKDMVIALPDDALISLEDRINMTRQFVQENFVDKGLAAQVDIHAPHENERNWHAHVLITTRRFTEDGKALGEKARDLDAEVRYGKVVEGEIWGEKWKEFQNLYFKKKGYELTVDETGLIPQEHLGPVRMRRFMGKESEIGLKAELLQRANEQLVKDPGAILGFLTRTQATFTEKDIDAFLRKHMDPEERDAVKKELFQHENLLQLRDHNILHPLRNTEKDLFTSKAVREEEKRIVRYAKTIESKNGLKTGSRAAKAVLKSFTLTEEQEGVYRAAIGRMRGYEDKGLVLIQGRAGTGKSYTLSAIREAYETDGKTVLGLAPTNVVAQDLFHEAGFHQAKTVHKMLFDHKNEREMVPKGSVLVVDEAGMIPNDAMTELLHVAQRTHSKVILVGDDRQLASVSRGGMFGYLAEKHGAVQLTEIRRQEVDWQKQVSTYVSEGKTKEALRLLDQEGYLHWHKNRSEAIRGLVRTWGESHALHPEKSQLIITHTNAMVFKLNEEIRHHLKKEGKLSDVEYECLTATSRSWSRQRFSEGDRVQFTQTDKSLGISNGILGTLREVRVKEDFLSFSSSSDSSSQENRKSYEFVVQQDNGKEVCFNPEEFHGVTHGYASTVYKAQGKTKPIVYVYHDGQGSQSLSYVALTRQKEELHVFTSREVAKDLPELSKQMSREEGKKASLHYDTLEDIYKAQNRADRAYSLSQIRSQENAVSFFIKHTAKDKIKDWTETLVTKAKDYLHRDEAFYTPQKRQEDITLEKAARRSGVSIELRRFQEERARNTLACDHQQLEREKGIYRHTLDTQVKLITPALEKQAILMAQELAKAKQKEQDISRGLDRSFF